jgi:tripartite-type tricarboxylate transporter receptor subunit TctC
MHIATIGKLVFMQAAAVALTLGAFAVQAQSYPERSIKMVIPFPPAGVTDIVARTMAAKLTDELGQTVVAENRAGASGAIGAEVVARSPSDGYTWVMGNISTMAINQWTMAKLNYDPLKSFDPVGMVSVQPLLIAVNPAVPAATLAELVAYAKANPGKLNYGTAGTSIHLAVEFFSGLAGIKMNHIPYKGSAPAVTDLMGGQIQVLFDPFSSVYPQVASGKVRGLAITTPERSKVAPNIPTVNESGYSGVDISSWQGILVPAGTPKEIVKKINAAMNKVLASNEIAEKFAQFSAVPTPWTPEQFGDYIQKEQARWGKVAKDAGIKPE